MDFFQHQDAARRRTKMLVFYYILALIAMTVALYALAVFVVATVRPDGYIEYLERMNYCDPLLFIMIGGGVVLLVGGASLMRTAQLTQGGGDAVAQQMGGRLIDPATTDLYERRLLNVVEEVAIAAGINVPNVYLLDHEQSINAFAAGYTPNTAALGITRGTMEYLTRDELQGVIGHEFSHVLNGDMRINIRLIGMLFGLNLFVVIGSIIMRSAMYSNMGSSYRSSGDGQSRAGGMAIASIVGIGLYIIGSVGMVCSSLIQAAISRQREYLADASSVQFTRNPAGISGALKKIGCRKVSSAIQDPHSSEAAHMFIANILGTQAMASLLATHPPLTDRIQRIDPSFNGVFPEVIYPLQLTAADAEKPKKSSSAGGRFPFPLPRPGGGKGAGSFPMPFPVPGQNSAQATAAGFNAMSSQLSTGFNEMSGLARQESSRTQGLATGMDSQTVIQRVGQLNLSQVDVAKELLANIPPEMEKHFRDSDGVRAVIFALLLSSSDEPTLNRQVQILNESVEPPCGLLAVNIFRQLAGFPVESKIPMIQKALPALRQLSPAQYRVFRNIVERLVAADGQIDLFEYTLRGLLLNDLDVLFGMVPPKKVKFTSISKASAPLLTTLSYLAYAGHTDKSEVESAFKAGLQAFGISGFLQPFESCTLTSFDDALLKLSEFSPEIKKKAITAFHACAASDRQITPREGELLRAISATLGCPMPIFS